MGWGALPSRCSPSSVLSPTPNDSRCARPCRSESFDAQTATPIVIKDAPVLLDALWYLVLAADQNMSLAIYIADAKVRSAKRSRNDGLSPSSPAFSPSPLSHLPPFLLHS